MKCEHPGCPVSTSGFDLFDYCATCGKNLCSGHMSAGCCGNVPAKSGMDADEKDFDEATAETA